MLSRWPALWFRAFPGTRIEVQGFHCVLLDIYIYILYIRACEGIFLTIWTGTIINLLACTMRELCGLFQALVSLWQKPYFIVLGKHPSLVIPLNSLHMKSTAQFGSSIIIFGVIKSPPGAFFGFSCFLMTSTILRARKKNRLACYFSAKRRRS